MIFKLHIGFFVHQRNIPVSSVEYSKYFSAKPLPFCKQNVITYLSFKLVEKFKEDMPVLGKMTDLLLSHPEEHLFKRQRH